MNSQRIGDNQVALLIRKEELERRGIQPDSASLTDILPLVEEALLDSGLVHSDHLCVEWFDGPDQLLVFVEADTCSCAKILVFDQLEHLIEAAGAIPDSSVCTTLTYYNEKYWLELTGSCDQVERLCVRLSEFAIEQQADDALRLQLAEYGKLIQRLDALAVLRRAFFKSEPKNK